MSQACEEGPPSWQSWTATGGALVAAGGCLTADAWPPVDGTTLSVQPCVQPVRPTASPFTLPSSFAPSALYRKQRVGLRPIKHDGDMLLATCCVLVFLSCTPLSLPRRTCRSQVPPTQAFTLTPAGPAAPSNFISLVPTLAPGWCANLAQYSTAPHTQVGTHAGH